MELQQQTLQKQKNEVQEKQKKSRDDMSRLGQRIDLMQLKMKILKVNVVGHPLMDMNLKAHQYQQSLMVKLK